MAINTYTVPSDRIVHETEVDFAKRCIQKTIHIVQYDKSLPIIAVKLLYNGSDYVLPAIANMKVRWSKRDRTFVYKNVLGCDASRKIVYFDVDEQMSVLDGPVNPILELIVSGNKAGTQSIPIVIDRNPVQQGDVESAVVVVLAPVAYTGSYNDLTDKPGTIEVNYNLIQNKPSINNVTLVGNLTLAQLGIASVSDLNSKSNATNIQNGTYTNSLIQNSIIPGTETHANVAGQLWAAIFGRDNTSGTDGYAAFTTGSHNSNNGDSAFVTGFYNTLRGNAWASIVGGNHNDVNGAYESLTIGEYNKLTSDATYGIMGGYYNEADGSGSLTFGRYNYNYTTDGFCGGNHNKTNIHHRSVLGYYNDFEETSGKTRLFEVGNGYIAQEYPDTGEALRPNNEWDYTVSPSVSSGQMYVDFKFTGTISSDVRTQFCLGDGTTFGGWYRVNSNGTLNQTYSGLSIARMGTTNWYRITIDISIAKPSGVSSISSVRFRGNFSDATGYFRVNPSLVDVEHRQNAFEVLDDGTLKFNKLTDGTTTKTVTQILSSGGGTQLYKHEIKASGNIMPDFIIISKRSTAYEFSSLIVIDDMLSGKVQYYYTYYNAVSINGYGTDMTIRGSFLNNSGTYTTKSISAEGFTDTVTEL